MDQNTKEAYKEKIQARIKEWEGQLEQLKNKADTASAETKVQIQKRINELRAKKEEFKTKLEGVSSAAEGAWEGLKEQLDKAGDSLSKSFKETFEKFKNTSGQ